MPTHPDSLAVSIEAELFFFLHGWPVRQVVEVVEETLYALVSQR